jgi:tetratricopeptide (TPR) repeat protein
MRLAALAAVIFLLGDSLIAGQPILIEGCGGNCGLFAILTALGEEPGGSLTAVEVSSRVTAAILVDTLAVEDLAETKEKLTAPFNSIKKKEDLDRARKILNHALDINPSDRQAFMIAADIFEPGQFFDEAAVYLSDLSDLIQAGGDLFARLWHPFFGSRNFTAAEINLNRARELSSTWKLIPKELGQFAAAKEDYGSALRFYEESLNSDPQDAETYFLRAEAAEFSGNWTLAADSLEHGLALQPDRSAYRTKLVQLYAEHQESEKAALNIQPLLENPPPDAKVLAMYAAFLEEIGQFDNALTLWKGAVELDPGMENAYYGMAHILLDQGHFSECLRATEEGLAHSPSSARLYLTKAAAQEKLGLWYGARRTLQQGSLAVEDLTLLEHRAEVEEQYGQNAGQAYQKLVLACEKIKADKKAS